MGSSASPSTRRPNRPPRCRSSVYDAWRRLTTSRICISVRCRRRAPHAGHVSFSGTLPSPGSSSGWVHAGHCTNTRDFPRTAPGSLAAVSVDFESTAHAFPLPSRRKPSESPSLLRDTDHSSRRIARKPSGLAGSRAQRGRTTGTGPTARAQRYGHVQKLSAGRRRVPVGRLIGRRRSRDALA